MAVSRRVLVRRGEPLHGARAVVLSLTLAWSAALSAAPAARAPDHDRQVLRQKERQARALQALLAGPTSEGDDPTRAVSHDQGERSERLLLLARLELEVAILRQALAEGRPDWEAPALTCRRLLVEAGAWQRADEARFFLAQVELRRNHGGAAIDELAELERRHPRSRLLCQSWLLAGEARYAQGRRSLAAESYRRVLGDASCAAALQQQARYKLAWSLLAAKQAAAAARELRLLLRHGELPAPFRARVLKDLVLAWSMGTPDADAPRLLLMHGGAGGGALSLEVARLLLQEKRLPQLLAFSASFLRLAGGGASPRAAAEQMRVTRLRAIAELSTAAALDRELAETERGGRSSALRVGAAQALLEHARRLEAQGAPRRQARALLERVVRSYAETGPAREARYHLAEAQQADGELAAAAESYQVAATSGPAGLRPLAVYRLVVILERLLAVAKEGARTALRRRFARAAWQLVRDHATRVEVPEVLLALAGQLVAGGDHSDAARAATSFLTRFPAHARRADAVALALHALDHAGRPGQAHDLAITELARPGAHPVAQAATLRSAALRCALRRSRELVGQGRLAEAQRWAQRAALANPGSAEASEAWLAAATLAVRGGRSTEAEAVYRALAVRSVGRSLQTRARVGLAELQETQGQFAAASVSYRAVAARVDGAERLRWLRRAGWAELAAGDRAGARLTARAVERLLGRATLRGGTLLREQLALGRLLLAAEGSTARRYFVGLARLVEKEQPRLAARLLLRAAEAAPARGRRLLEEAQTLAGPLRRHGGQVVEEAAEARLALARHERARQERSLRRRLLALQLTSAQLVELVTAGDARWSSEAGVLLAWSQEEMAQLLSAAPAPRGLRVAEVTRYRAAVANRVAELRQVRQAILVRLGAVARRPTALSAGVLAVAREQLPAAMPGLRAEALPDPSTLASPVIDLLRAGRNLAAALAASRALAVVGEREDLLCVRGVARQLLGRPQQAILDWEAAQRLAPRSTCARQNLATVALWVQDYGRARRLLDGLSGEQALTAQAAAAYGLGEHVAASKLARRALAADSRSEAACLLAALLTEQLQQPAAALPLLRAAVDAKLSCGAEARRQLARLRERPSPRQPSS
jgi:TolA-binding protein